jgi:ABC-type ATPase involved in cell division
MIIKVNNKTKDFNTYRAARVKSLFNPERGNEFTLEADIPVEGLDWSIGLIVGPSGTGKTSMGRAFFGEDKIVDLYAGWPSDEPIVDAIAPGGDFDSVTGALANVGLGDVPAWLRPFHALSNGQQFRAGLARAVSSGAGDIVIDEFTSVVDRQIAKIGAMAFSKGWRRSRSGRAVLLSCHYDIVEWLQPDWVFDTGTGEFKKKTKSGQGQKSSWKFGRSAEVTGECLSRIII